MPARIVMPRLGWTMEEGTLVAWRKRDGDRVEAGEILFEVETDKALNEVPSFETGILHIPPDAPATGDTVPVGTLLAYVLAPGEVGPLPPAPSPERGGGEDDLASIPPSPFRGSRSDDPSALAAEGFPPPARGRTGGPGGRGRTRRHGRLAISPRALRAARELGIDWSGLSGSGRTGRIRERDVRAAAALAATPVEVQPLTPTRRLIAGRLTEAAQTAAAVTLTTEVDAGELVALHDRLKQSLTPRKLAAPTYNDLMVKLTALALEEHPLLNASWEEGGIRLHREVHLGIAVDTDAGLMVPVIRDAPAKSLRQIAAEARELAEKARKRALLPADLQGGTFTITNLGAYGIDAFTPLLHLPQCAILGVGRIHRKPAVYNDHVVPRPMMALSLTFDHRVVDGGPAARFLGAIAEYVEDPYLWIGR
jgi:pyruvate dehydrogenase E2 component (dihydrolipoamide acetyltransferase)